MLFVSDKTFYGFSLFTVWIRQNVISIYLKRHKSVTKKRKLIIQLIDKQGQYTHRNIVDM